MPTAPGFIEGYRIRVRCGFEDGAINMGYWMRLRTLHPCLYRSFDIMHDQIPLPVTDPSCSLDERDGTEKVLSSR